MFFRPLNILTFIELTFIRIWPTQENGRSAEVAARKLTESEFQNFQTRKYESTLAPRSRCGLAAGLVWTSFGWNSRQYCQMFIGKFNTVISKKYCIILCSMVSVMNRRHNHRVLLWFETIVRSANMDRPVVVLLRIYNTKFIL